jgi:aminodeoxyfutalosine deaminase
LSRSRSLAVCGLGLGEAADGASIYQIRIPRIMPNMADTSANDCSLTARWVFPVDGPPIERGIVAVRGEHIVAVEPHGTRVADLDLGNAAILPGLVNAHTHLDLSGLRGKCPPSPDFTGWLRQVIAHRRTVTPEQTQADIRTGIEECLRYGTTLVGDIASGGASWDALAEAPLRAVVFHEVLGLTDERAQAAATVARQWLQTHDPTPNCRPALSPHAPYSVRASLLEESVRLARQHRIRLAIHLAESSAELELLSQRRGPFVAFLKDLGVWDPAGLIEWKPSRVDTRWCLLVPVVFVHVNYAGHSLFSRNAAVVHCPRTHAAFGHPPYPLNDFLRQDIPIALGTDGLSSNPDLDMLAEMRFLHHRRPDIPPGLILRMATLAGAEALGWTDVTGSLTPGKSADLVVLPLPDHDADDPHRLLFESDRAVSRVMFRGRWRER